MLGSGSEASDSTSERHWEVGKSVTGSAVRRGDSSRDALLEEGSAGVEWGSDCLCSRTAAAVTGLDDLRASRYRHELDQRTHLLCAVCFDLGVVVGIQVSESGGVPPLALTAQGRLGLEESRPSIFQLLPKPVVRQPQAIRRGTGAQLPLLCPRLFLVLGLFGPQEQCCRRSN